MHFYRSINTIKALTFDLDDTLYDNAPFMAKAETALIQSLRQYDQLKNVQLTDFNKVKSAVAKDQPDIYHDVIIWRAETLRQFLILNGIDDQVLRDKIIAHTMQEFIVWRNKVVVPQESLTILSLLHKKYPLAVITNGNAEIEKIGLADYFQFSLRGGPDGLSKPFSDMFDVAAQRLNIKPENILHVGDNLDADVVGSLNSGMQACWINTTSKNVYQLADARLLPHIEISQLSELNFLL